jgi:uncharacterized protein YajQ (UPF0234 family)
MPSCDIVSRVDPQIATQEGVHGDSARHIVRPIEDRRLTVQAAIQHHAARVTGKKIDDFRK